MFMMNIMIATFARITKSLPTAQQIEMVTKSTKAKDISVKIAQIYQDVQEVKTIQNW